MQPLVSVVTPVYNKEKYLRQCIGSILSQSYENWEYIIVNNCSTDHSLEIATQYACRDPRIRIHDNATFLGQVPNYNLSLRLISAESKYCKIVQADDWLFPECLSEMVLVAEENPSVGIVSSYQLFGKQVKGAGLRYPSHVVSGREICRMQLLQGYFFFGSPTSLLLRCELVRNRDPFYSESSLHEDTEVCYELLKSWDFGFVHQVLTFSRTEDPESMSSLGESLDPYLLDKLIIVSKYGRTYLSVEEFDKCWRAIDDRYHRYLAEAFFTLRDWKFWDYHKRGLKTIGYHLNLAKLLKFGWLELVDLLVHPILTTRLMRRKASKLLFHRNGTQAQGPPHNCWE